MRLTIGLLLAAITTSATASEPPEWAKTLLTKLEAIEKRMDALETRARGRTPNGETRRPSDGASRLLVLDDAAWIKHSDPATQERLRDQWRKYGVITQEEIADPIGHARRQAELARQYEASRNRTPARIEERP